MAFDLTTTLATRAGENYELNEKYVNRTFVKVLRTIGFDKVYERGEGAYLYDREGQDYLDFLSGYGVYNIGRNHPAIKKVIEDALKLDLPNMVQMDSSLLAGLLAEALVARTGPERDAVYFCNSGAEAVEAALKFARAATQRERIISLSGAYHGLTYGALSMTAVSSFQEGFAPFLPGVQHVSQNNLEALEDALRRKDVAAFIAEPVQGKGVNIPDDDFLPKAQELCRKYGTLFIADEVQTGFGRTGKYFAYQHWDLDPDIVTLAKTLSGGYVPCAAMITRRKIEQKVFSRLDRCVVHNTSFGGNSLAMACGLATLDVIDREKLVENARVMGDLLATRLRGLMAKHELIKEVRALGLMVAVEFQQPASFKLKMAWKAIHAVDKGLFAQMIVTPLLQKHRIIAQVAGHNMDVIKVIPALTIGEKEIDRFVAALDDVLEDVTRFPGPVWDFGTNLVKQALKR
jgi:ornithine--oxo-acid transaminase